MYEVLIERQAKKQLARIKGSAYSRLKSAILQLARIMSRNHCILLLLLYMPVLTIAQEKKVDLYWKKNAIEKDEIAKKIFKEKGIILMDSITTDKIRLFLFEKGIGVFSLDIIYGPQFYNVKDLIKDSLCNMGIFMFGVESSHPGTYLFFKKGNKVTFLDNNKEYEIDRLVKRILAFLKENEDVFDRRKQIELWEKLTKFYKSFSGFVGSVK